jgi:hypothetical protein
MKFATQRAANLSWSAFGAPACGACHPSPPLFLIGEPRRRPLKTSTTLAPCSASAASINWVRFEKSGIDGFCRLARDDVGDHHLVPNVLGLGNLFNAGV